MKDKYIVTVVQVPQTPVDNQHDIVVVYDKDTKKCLCSNKYKSQVKSRDHVIKLLESKGVGYYCEEHGSIDGQEVTNDDKCSYCGRSAI